MVSRSWPATAHTAQNMYTSVTQAVRQQLEERPHEFVFWNEIAKRIQSDRDFEGAFVGAYSITVPKLNKTFVSNRHLWIGKPVSAASIARRLLYTSLPLLKRKRIPWNRRALPLLDIPHPLFCIPSTNIGNLFYFDLRGAYYSIYKRLPLEFWFNGVRSLGGELKFEDFLPPDLRDYKLLRNCIVGCMRTRESRRVRGGRVVITNNHNALLSPYHWGFIAHLLHAIANKAVDLGAIYYNTDGAIFLNLEEGLKWSSFVAELGLTPDLKQHGIGYVHGVGRYKIGGDVVGNIKSIPLPFSNLCTPGFKVLADWRKYS